MTHAQPQKKSFFNMNVDLMHGPILKSLLLFMLPILVSNLFQQLYNTVDTMIVGNVLGDTALAAIGSCGSIYELLVGFGIGIGNGLAIVAARSYGAQDEDLLKRTVVGSVVIGLIASLVITTAGFFGLHALLQLLDTPAEILEDAYSYIIVIDLGVVVMFMYNLCAGLLRAIGNSVMPLVFLLISSVLNVGLDLWFIAGVGMGVRGAAVATVIAQGISVVLCVLYVLARVCILIPEKKHFAVGSHLYWELFSQSISMGLMSSIVSAGSVVLQYGINGLGTLTIAGHTAARKLFAFTEYAAHLHGERRFHLRFPEPRRKPARPCAQGNAADVSVLGGGDGRRRGADELWCSVDGAADLRLFGTHRAGKRCAVPAVERTVLCGAGGAAVHPLRAAEPWPEGAAAVLQRDRAGGQGDLCAGVHPEIPVQCGHPVRAHHLVLHDGISGGGVPARALCVPEKITLSVIAVRCQLSRKGELFAFYGKHKESSPFRGSWMRTK